MALKYRIHSKVALDVICTTVIILKIGLLVLKAEGPYWNPLTTIEY